MLFGKCAMITLGVFPFSCFLLSTAATPFTALTSWCLQKALEMSRGALKTVLLLCVTQKCHVGEERSGPGYCMVTKPHELLCHTAVPRYQGLLPAAAAAAMEHPSGGEGRSKPLLFSASSLL